MITHRPRASARCPQDHAVLADLGGAVPQRLGRHRRARHGLADAAGNLRRLADRPCRMSASPSSTPGRRQRSPPSPPASPACCRCSTSAAGSSGPRCRTGSAARHTYFVFFAARHRAVCTGAAAAQHGQQGAVRARSSASSCRCTAAASRPCRPIWPNVRHAVRRRDPRPAADGLVDGRHHRARWSSTTSAKSQIAAGVPRGPGSMTAPCISSPACWRSGSSPTALIRPLSDKWFMSDDGGCRACRRRRPPSMPGRRVPSASAQAGWMPRRRLPGRRRHSAALGCLDDAETGHHPVPVMTLREKKGPRSRGLCCESRRRLQPLLA